MKFDLFFKLYNYIVNILQYSKSSEKWQWSQYQIDVDLMLLTSNQHRFDVDSITISHWEGYYEILFLKACNLFNLKPQFLPLCQIYGKYMYLSFITKS